MCIRITSNAYIQHRSDKINSRVVISYLYVRMLYLAWFLQHMFSKLWRWSVLTLYYTGKSLQATNIMMSLRTQQKYCLFFLKPCKIKIGIQYTTQIIYMAISTKHLKAYTSWSRWDWMRVLGKHRRRLEYDIKMNIRETDVIMWLRRGTNGGLFSTC